jgi:hypothetical protein
MKKKRMLTDRAPYNKITINIRDFEELTMIMRWFRDNDIECPDYHHNGHVKDIGNAQFYFTNEKDAALFALRWS